MISQTLSHYRIVEKIGAGGMGEVYVAEDQKLGRQVALKVLRPEVVGSAERRRRFEQEAKALAALNHPNIVSVYSVEEAEGVDFITMELVRGRPLSQLIPKGGLALSELFGLAVPLADALAAAHERGITHRDLKPDNVMVAAEGRVKVLDFGLAKLRQESLAPGDSQLSTESRTEDGRIVGTVAYMSPEQAEGRPVDHRSDIFSLGIVLYEMATGERPFSGESATKVLTSILHDTPRSVTELRPMLPKELGRIIRRALAKDREKRIQTAKELRNELQELKAEVDPGEAWERPPPTPFSWKRWVAVAGLGILALGAVVGIWMGRSREQLRAVSVIPLTSDGAAKEAPALSPDGKLIAFVRYGDASSDLYVKQIGGGEPIRIARGVTGEVAWSPDGGEITFFRHVEAAGKPDAAGIFLIPALGGAERQVAIAYTRNHGLSWSPDGKILAITDGESPDEPDGIFLFSRETGEKRRLTKPPPEYLGGDSSPRFSPDGRAIAFVRGVWFAPSDIYLVPVEGGEPRRLTFGNHRTIGLGWTANGKSIVFSSNRSPRAGFFALWWVSASGGEPKPLEFGEQGVEPTLSRQGQRLAYIKHLWDLDVWRVGGPTAGKAGEPPVRFISSSWLDWGPEYSPDGQRVLFNSSRSGHSEIWVCDSDGSNPRQLTFLEDPLTIFGRWSPDGRQIAFMSPKEGTFHVYLIDAAGGIPRQLTTESWTEMLPRWSRDSRWIYFASNRSGRSDLWKIPAGGGKAIQVTRNRGLEAAESQDGRYLYFTKRGWEGGPPGVWRMPIAGGEELQVLDRVRWADWAMFERGICYFNREAKPGTAIEFFDFATSQVSRIAALEDEPSQERGFSVSPDGRWILYVKIKYDSDIMLVENFR